MASWRRSAPALAVRACGLQCRCCCSGSKASTEACSCRAGSSRQSALARDQKRVQNATDKDNAFLRVSGRLCWWSAIPLCSCCALLPQSQLTAAVLCSTWRTVWAAGPRPRIST